MVKVLKKKLGEIFFSSGGRKYFFVGEGVKKCFWRGAGEKDFSKKKRHLMAQTDTQTHTHR